MSNGINYKRIICLLLSIFISIYVARNISIETAESLSSMLVTIFSVLAGFMIALMAMTAQTVDLRSWKYIAISRETILSRMFRQKQLFYSYLITLGLIVASMVINDVEIAKSYENSSLLKNLDYNKEIVQNFFRQCYVFFGVLSLCMSFTLPGSILKEQKKILDKQLEQAKSQK